MAYRGVSNRSWSGIKATILPLTPCMMKSGMPSPSTSLTTVCPEQLSSFQSKGLETRTRLEEDADLELGLEFDVEEMMVVVLVLE